VESRWDTARTEAFSDGVFAIAITLLVLDINVPESDFDDLWQGIANQWPSYLGYVTSFATIGGLWLAHHGIFRRIQYADARVTRLNLILLMIVSFLPFPTRLMAETIRNSDAETTAAIFYGTTLLAISVVTWALWQTVARNRDLLGPDVTDDEVRAILRMTAPNIGGHPAGPAHAAGRGVRLPDHLDRCADARPWHAARHVRPSAALEHHRVER